MSRILTVILVVLLLTGFWWWTQPEPAMSELREEPIAWSHFYTAYLKPHLPVADSFALPLFPPDGNGAYIKRGFQERQCLGEEWALEPDQSKKEVPVYASAGGVVILADDFGAVWGKVVIILHRLPDGDQWPMVETMYANLAELKVKKGQTVAQGEVIGVLGKTQVTDDSELHFEIRTEPGHMLGPGEAELSEGWVSPTEFMEARSKHQRAPAGESD